MKGNVQNSIVIPVFNGNHYLHLFWDTLYRYLLPDSEIIVVDDGSTQNISETMGAIKDCHGLKIVRHEYPMGFSKSVNDGLRVATGDYLFILNSDLILMEKTLTNLLEAIKADPKLGIVGATLLYPQTGKIQHAGIAFSETNHFHIFANTDLDSPLIKSLKYMQAVAFACCCMPRIVLEKVGYLNENYFNSYEDFDYCFRIHEQDYLIALEPSAVAYHWERQAGVIRRVLRKDNVARLWRDWGKKMVPDLHQYFIKSWKFFKNQHQELIDNKFTVINLSRGREAGNIIRLLGTADINLNISDIIENRQRGNDVYHLWLPQIMPVDAASFPLPYLYLVDEHPQLHQNIYWFQLRKNFVKEEIILDYHANFLTVSSLFQNSQMTEHTS
jgi:GT2 family glycosyltransferase